MEATATMPERDPPSIGASPASRGASPALFAVTMFVGASLLFVVQPMVGKMILPLLGGTPAVWTTCMVFFQAALLAGYAYAHLVTTRLGTRGQVLVQAGVLLLALAVLPIGVPRGAAGSMPVESDPTGWLLILMAGAVGLPFFAVATTAPLLQRWFSRIGHARSGDPYFLYSASNLGSLLALLAYPLALEPLLRLATQGAAWSIGFGGLAALTLCCGAALWNVPEPIRADAAGADEADAGPIARRAAGWVGLAFVPSSLMLGVTTYVSTDLGSFPLLWVLPLTLYLLSFILTFADRPPLRHAWMTRAMPMGVVLLTLTLGLGMHLQLVFLPIHLVTFFLVAMVCHGELARRRPGPRRLTAFYLALSVGGVLGGLFNAVAAPLVFDRVAEYEVVLALSCLALPGPAAVARPRRGRLLDAVLPALLAAGLVGGAALLRAWAGGDEAGLWVRAPFVLGALACFAFTDRPARFALGVAAVLGVAGLASIRGEPLLQERNFFGVLRVYDLDGPDVRVLVHGSTIHGMQSLDPARRGEPLTYYHRDGPMGQVDRAFAEGGAAPTVAVVGLGAGSLAAYARPDQRWMYYEIDPAVERVARDPHYFTFLRDCRAERLGVTLGDARFRLAGAPDRAYGLIVLDAFSSDAIPTHLLTLEAVRLYRSKLARGGLLVFHISNRYFDLAPVLGTLARDAGLTARIRRDLDVSPEEFKAGHQPSIWVAMAASPADLGALADDERWEPVEVAPDRPAWTDDYSNLLGALSR